MKTKPNIAIPYDNIPLLLLSAAAIGFLAARAVIMNSYHWDIGGIENSVVYSASKMLYGLPLYGDPESLNFDVTQYTPVYYHCLVGLARLADINPMADLHRIFLIGRGLSLVFDVLSAALVYRLLAVVFKVDRRLSACAAILSLLTLSDFHFAARPDSLFSLFGTAVLYCFSMYLSVEKDSRIPIHFLIGLLIVSLSMFVKQSGIQYAVFIPLFLLSQRMYRESWVSAAAIALMSTSFYLLSLDLHGPHFNKNVVGGVDNGISLPIMTDLLSIFLSRHQTSLVLGALSVAYSLSCKNESLSNRFLSLLTIWLFVFALGTSAKRGSWLNYYTDFLNALIVITAVKADRLFKRPWSDEGLYRILKATWIICLLVYIPSLMIQTLGPKLKQHAPRAWGRYPSMVAEKEKAADFLRSHLGKGEYFLGFDRHIELMLADRAVMPNKEMIPTHVTYRYDGFYKAIEDGTIRYVVVNRSKPREEFMDIDYTDFAKIYEDETFLIFENPR